MGTRDKDLALIEQFVAAFPHLDPSAAALSTSDDEHGASTRRPAKVANDRSQLEPIYETLPARFPRLLELLILTVPHLRRSALFYAYPGLTHLGYSLPRRTALNLA
jgi:hypothetical protein